VDNVDYIIIGAGTAGCVLADRLSAGGDRVLLLEAGGTDRRFWIKTPIGYGRTFADPAVNWKYQTLPNPGLNGRSIYWPRGRGDRRLEFHQRAGVLPRDARRLR